MIQENINLIIGTLTLLSNIFFVLVIVFVVFSNVFRSYIYNLVNRRILSILFIFSITASVGSVVYSNIAGFPPCELCWIQRIFMFPQPVLLFLALLKKDKGIVSYLFPLTILGGIVAFYHSLTNWGFGGSFLDCTAVGGECSRVYVLEYGYITIPFMAFTSFAFLLLISIIYFKSTKERI